MTDNYPPVTPKWAASIWATDAWLYLELPSAKGLAKHTVRFNNTPKGLALALGVIRKRTSESRIGEKGDLTRHQVTKFEACPKLFYREALVKKAKPKDSFSAEARQAARDALRKVGIL